MQMILEE